ncbi:MAG: hypothetical protein APF76_13210 [Desulfitibacter sp. BRH_c19]|nr:MAG: hypothetical protein APF76_13210 [Desulfitibacter sp. BRH_c19]
MSADLALATTGLNELDKIIDKLRIGDNVVWQVEDVNDYHHFIMPYIKRALEDNKRVVYMRFARHKPLIKVREDVAIYKLDAHRGFEYFSSQVHNIVTREGEDVYYVFDCLSDLQEIWATDTMIGNFFVVTCPYLFQSRTIAYFAIYRNNHSFKTIASIRETTQLLIDVFSYEGNLYVHPLKAWKRYSPTMFLPHKKAGESFVPITNSYDTTVLLSYMAKKRKKTAKRNLDYWDQLFLDAANLLERPSGDGEKHQMVEQLCKIMIGREKRILGLAINHFTLEDLLNIKARLIGTGFIGGKAAGMLIARNILLGDKTIEWQTYIEPHDSFYIGSDVFYTYLVKNGWWKLRMKQKAKKGYFVEAQNLKEKMLTGEFPEEIKEQFLQMIEYFGQSPFIVRSSSLLEDGFGNAFAGKYESIFCVNQGTPDERYKNFKEAVRKIYASVMNEDALAYRMQRGLDQQDEQMALLVQRVSGAYYNNYFFPYLAGVGISHNTFVWNKDLDPEAGMLRLVFGLGTRAVNRVENDYPRLVALDEPLLRPHAGLADIRRFSQHYVDVLNVRDNRLETVTLKRLTNEKLDINMEPIGLKDYESIRKLKEICDINEDIWILNFDNLFSNTSFNTVMKKMLKKLERIYEYPVDTEFTVNFNKDGSFKINLLQCRPLQTQGSEEKVTIPKIIDDSKLILKLENSFMGGSISREIQRIIYVDPKSYSELTTSQRYETARIVGKLNKKINDKFSTPTLLLGPGRWGTTTPSLGIPVSFSEINNIAVIGEIAHKSGSLSPELSYGSHFFQDLVETNIFYMAIFPSDHNVFFNWDWFNKLPNELSEVLSDKADYSNVVKICDLKDSTVTIVADIVTQKLVCLLNNN